MKSKKLQLLQTGENQLANKILRPSRYSVCLGLSGFSLIHGGAADKEVEFVELLGAAAEVCLFI